MEDLLIRISGIHKKCLNDFYTITEKYYGTTEFY